MTSIISEPLKSALFYASRGWLVFPLHTVVNHQCTCRIPNCKAPGKHPRTNNGFKDATLDPTKIRRWWREFPNANVAIVTGERSGFFAVDVDPRHFGDESLEELEQRHGRLPETVQALTGGGGRHILFAYEGNSAIGSRNNFLQGIDIKANGGYIVAPPSRHFSGNVYAWDTLAHPEDMPISRAPSWLLSALSVNREKNCAIRPVSSAEWEAILSDACREGSRHASLTRLVGHLLAKDVDMNIVATMVTAFDRVFVNPPQGELAVLKIVRDIAERHMNRHRGRGVGHVG